MASPVAASTTADQEAKRMTKKATRVLLPSHVRPLRYELALEPDLEAFTFTGKVNIIMTVDPTQLDDDNNNNNSITLHAKELAFLSAEYTVLADSSSTDTGTTTTSTSTAPVKASEIHLNIKATTVKFVFESPIPRTAARIRCTIHYTGILNNQMAGFYRSAYTDSKGQAKYMASTQFEAIDARRAFPCVDEPAAKAIFALTLTIPYHLQCVSNMPELSCITQQQGLKRQVTFMDSPKMSTYLLAFCVGEFDFIQATCANSGVLIRVLTPPGRSDSGHFALDVAKRALDVFDEFFHVPYPLPKLDMVAVTEFSAGAMENWGLVTYREVDLLIDPITASSGQKQRVAVVVTHELSHQWFGNLVTMAWWDDLWLNEGFASWCENWATNVLFPDYKMWDQFVSDAFSSALRLDSLKSSHPIQVPIHHAEEVEQVFDAVSYCKGGSVVRMIKAVVGMQNFQNGLKTYMKKYSYGNTETIDLWNCWQEASQLPIAELMASWTEQMGFPMLRVTAEDWKDDKVTLEVEQSWFLSDGSELDEEGKAKKWTIPILTGTETGTQDDLTLMREKTATVTIPLPNPTAWAKLNAGHEVLMRVLPTDEMLRRLAVGVSNKTMAAIDRAGLVNDTYALVKAGHMSPESLVRLLASYKDEDDFVVWGALSDALGGLDFLLGNASELPQMAQNLQKFAKGMVVPLLEKIGWDSQPTDTHLTTLLRGILVSLLTSFAYDDEKVAAEAKKRFQAFQEDASDVKSLPADIRTQVFKIVLKNGGKTEYEQVKAYFNKATDGAEKKRVLNSLGNTEDPKLKLATMEWSTSGEIKLQDCFYLMGSVGRSKNGGDISWKYFQDNFDKIKNMLISANPSLMDAVIVTCAGSFASAAKADEIEAFFTANPLPKNTRKIAQLTESIRINSKFLTALQNSELTKDEFWNQLS